MAVKKNSLWLLILINFTCVSQDNLTRTNQDEIVSRIDNMLDSIDSTLELQNTAIALLQKQLYAHKKNHTFQLCILSAALASAVTFLVIRNLEYLSIHPTTFNPLIVSLSNYVVHSRCPGLKILS
jgi:hypothetical protein